MSTNFPTSVDNGTSLPYPGANNLTNSPSLASGANTIAASKDKAYVRQNTFDNLGSYAVLLTGLSAGSTTFTCKYEVLVGGTAQFYDRTISVIPL